jgi:signal transduction histidine kinase
MTATQQQRGSVELRTVVTSLAHELTQPLAAIVANCDTALRWLRMMPPDIERIGRAVERTRRDVQRASAAIERSVALVSRPESEQPLVHIGELVLEVMTVLAPEMRHHRIQVRSLVPSELPSVIGSRVELQYVFACLLTNVIETLGHVEERARKVSLECERRYEGSGEAVFVAIQRLRCGVDETGSEPPADLLVSGCSAVVRMSLAASRSIVRRHGGDLQARNTREGLRFEIHIPVSP